MRKIYFSGWPEHGLTFGLSLFLILLFGQLNAQTSRYVISGKVTDTKTQETLPGVAVRLNSTTFAISTNVDGNYSLVANASPGQYTVTFSYIGYKNLTKTIQLGADMTINLDASCRMLLVWMKLLSQEHLRALPAVN